MTKQEYLNRVAEIFETLSFAIQDFKDGKLSNEEMQSIIKKAWEDKPKDYMLVNIDLAEMFELDEEMVGEVVETAPYEDEGTRKFQNQMIEELIEDVPSLKTNGLGRLSIHGSNSMIITILGEAEWDYLR